MHVWCLGWLPDHDEHRRDSAPSRSYIQDEGRRALRSYSWHGLPMAQPGVWLANGSHLALPGRRCHALALLWLSLTPGQEGLHHERELQVKPLQALSEGYV